MATLMDSLSQAVTPEVIGKIGTKLGVDDATAQKATEIGVPLITGGMAKASSTSAGASSIFDMLGQLDPNMAGSPDAGSKILDGLFGSALGPITGQIKQATGIDVAQFLPMLAPLVAGAIGKFAKGNNLDAAGLANTLQTETKAFADSGNPVASLVSGAMTQIGSPISSAGQMAGQTAGAVAGAAGAAAATAGAVAQQAGSTVSSAANSAASTAGSMARDVSSTADSMARDVSSTMTSASGGRPMGITILGVLAIIGGVISLCGGAGLLGLGTMVGGAGAASASGEAVGLGAISGLLGLGSLASGILSLVGGIGLLGLKNWARILVLIGAIIGVVSALLSLISALSGAGDPISAILGLVINGVILWYLNRPDVKAAFGK